MNEIKYTTYGAKVRCSECNKFFLVTNMEELKLYNQTISPQYAKCPKCMAKLIRLIRAT